MGAGDLNLDSYTSTESTLLTQPALQCPKFPFEMAANTRPSLYFFWFGYRWKGLGKVLCTSILKTNKQNLDWGTSPVSF